MDGDNMGYRGRGAGMQGGGGYGGWPQDAQRATAYAAAAQQSHPGYTVQGSGAQPSAQYGYGHQAQQQQQQQAQQYYGYGASRGGAGRGGGYGYMAGYGAVGDGQGAAGYYADQQSSYVTQMPLRGGGRVGRVLPGQQMQSYASGYAARGGYYGSGYGQTPQAMGMGGPNAAYYDPAAYAAYGGGAAQMMYGAGQPYGYGRFPPQQQQQQYVGRGRGAVRGGRGGFSAARLDVYYLVHLDSFTKLEELGRKGSFVGIVDERVLMTIRSRSRGGVPRVLVIVDKKYLGATMSIPHTADDVILSATVATELLDVSAVVYDDGSYLVELPSGAHVAKHIYIQLRSYLRQVTAFDKPVAGGEPPAALDVLNASSADLLRGLTSSKHVYDAVVSEMRQNTAESTALFGRLLHPQPGDAAAEDEEHAEEEANTAAASATDKAAGPARQSIGLMNSAQGVRVLAIALQHRAKRRLFFDQMLVGLSESADSAAPTSVHDGAELFKTFFCCMLTPSIIFDCFRLGPAAAAAEPTELQSTDYDADVEVLCSCFARYGIMVISCNGGSCLTAALVKVLRPRFTSYDARPAAVTAGRGGKRGREGDAGAAQQQQRTEDGVVRQSAVAASETNVAPRSIAAFVPAAPPLDWRFFYAAASAFVQGELTPALTSTMGETGDNTSGVAVRVQLMCEHIVGCRAVQVMLPHLADFYLRYAKEQSTGVAAAASPREAAFLHHCEVFLRELARQADRLIMHSYGNYVVQTLIAEFAPRAVPGTIVDTTLRSVIDCLFKHIFEVSVQKFSSNCVERVIGATQQLPDGTQIILRLARALLERGEQGMLTVASHQYGNYVMRHLCEHLTEIATSTAKTPATAEETAEAKALEMRVFRALRTRMMQLQGTSYGVGLVNWMQTQQSRLGITARTA